MKLDRTQMMRRAIRLWSTGDRDVDRHNRRAWLRAAMRLGDRWILAHQIQRVEK